MSSPASTPASTPPRKPPRSHEKGPVITLPPSSGSRAGKNNGYDDDNDSLDKLTLLDVLAEQEKLRTHGGVANRGLDVDDLESEMTSSVVVEDVDDIVTVPVFSDVSNDSFGSSFSHTNPFRTEPDGVV